MDALYYATSAFVARWSKNEGYEVKNLQTGQWVKNSDPTLGWSLAMEGTQISPHQVDKIHSLLMKTLLPLPSTKEIMKYLPPMRTLIKSIKPRL